MKWNRFDGPGVTSPQSNLNARTGNPSTEKVEQVPRGTRVHDSCLGAPSPALVLLFLPSTEKSELLSTRQLPWVGWKGPSRGVKKLLTLEGFPPCLAGGADARGNGGSRMQAALR